MKEAENFIKIPKINKEEIFKKNINLIDTLGRIGRERFDQIYNKELLGIDNLFSSYSPSLGERTEGEQPRTGVKDIESSEAVAVKELRARLEDATSQLNKARAEVVSLEGSVTRLQERNHLLTMESALAKERARNSEEAKRRLELDNMGLARQVIALQGEVRRLSVDSTQGRPGYDSSDPKGYFKALGINPAFLAKLPDEQAKKYLRLAFNACAQVVHPDAGGSNQAMVNANLAYEFLKDPVKRRGYGRKI